MSKTIKLENEVYDKLEVFRDKRETFSEAVERLLQARLKMFEVLDIVEATLRFQEWKQKQLLKAVQE